MAASSLRRGCTSLAQRLLPRGDVSAAAAPSANAVPQRGQTALFSAAAGDPTQQQEEAIAQLLRERMPGAKAVRVQDTSGGCGSMYRIEVAADEFRGINVVKQHQLVTKALQDEIPKWHGFVLETKAT